MTASSDLLKLVPTLQAVALLEDNYTYLKKKKKKLIHQGIKNLIGLSFVKATAESL